MSWLIRRLGDLLVGLILGTFIGCFMVFFAILINKPEAGPPLILLGLSFFVLWTMFSKFEPDDSHIQTEEADDE